MKRLPLKSKVKTGRFIVPYRIYDNLGPHIICLNGVQQSMAMWHSFIRYFSSRYRIVLFDFPGQGKGQILSGSNLVSLDEQVDILYAVIKDTHSNNDLTICTASWGGVVAVAFAAKYPQAVKRLNLASLGTKANQKMMETIKRGVEINMEDRDKMAETLIESFGQGLPEEIRRKITNQFRSLSKENLQAFYEHGLFVMSTKEIGDLVNLAKIKAKTTLINGEKDTIIDLEDVKFLASQIPDCEIKIVKDTGHFLHLEREEVFDIYEDILPAYR